VSIREKVVTKIVTKWMFKYHISIIIDVAMFLVCVANVSRKQLNYLRSKLINIIYMQQKSKPILLRIKNLKINLTKENNLKINLKPHFIGAFHQKV